MSTPDERHDLISDLVDLTADTVLAYLDLGDFHEQITEAIAALGPDGDPALAVELYRTEAETADQLEHMAVMVQEQLAHVEALMDEH